MPTDSLVTILAGMVPTPRASGSGRPSRFTADEIVAMYAARKRHLSWGDVNRALEAAGMETYKRSSTLAQVVHETAERLGIPVHKTVTHRPGRTKTSKAA